VAVIGVRLDHSSLTHDPTYGALALPELLTCVGLAAVVPGALIMTSKLSWPRRVGLIVIMLWLLALECGITFYIAMLSEVGCGGFLALSSLDKSSQLNRSMQQSITC
jgi:hypothetical protein